MFERKIREEEIVLPPGCSGLAMQVIEPHLVPSDSHFRDYDLMGWKAISKMACIGTNEGDIVEIGDRYIRNRLGAQKEVCSAAREAGMAAVGVCAKCPMSGLAALAEPAVRIAALRLELLRAEQGLPAAQPEALLAPYAPGSAPEAVQE